MKIARKSLAFIISFIYISSLLYLPLSPNDILKDQLTKDSLSEGTKNETAESLLTPKAKAQSSVFQPQFVNTLDLGPVRTYPWGQDRFGGFKMGEIRDNSGNPRVIAVGYGSLWVFNNTNNTWSQGPSYVCNTEEDGNVGIGFFQNHVIINRIGNSGCGENFNVHLIQIFGFQNNNLVQTYNSNKQCSQLTSYDQGAYIPVGNGGCIIGLSNGAAYSSRSTFAGNALYFGFFRSTPDSSDAPQASLFKISGFVGETPVMTKLCRGTPICYSLDFLVGAGNGQLYGFTVDYEDNNHSFLWTMVSLSTDPNNFNKVDTPLNIKVSRDHGDYVTISDSSIFSDGRVRLAMIIRRAPVTWNNGDCRSAETVQQIIYGFTPDGGRGIANLGSLAGNPVPTGICNGGLGYAYNGGGFVEANGIILYGYTYCYGDSGLHGDNRYTSGAVKNCSDGTTGNGLLQLVNGTWTGLNMRGTQAGNPNYNDVRTISMFYSPSFRKLFSSIRNYPFTPGTQPNIVYRPGIWVHSFVPPIVNACTNLLFNGNSTSGTLSPASPNINVVNNGTSTNASGQGFVDIIYNGNVYSRKYANGVVSNATTGAYSMTVGFNLENDLKALQLAGAAQATVRVVIPGAGAYAAESACTIVLNITSYANPGTNGQITGACAPAPQNINPYQVVLSLQAHPSNVPGAQVNKMRVIVTPSNDATNYSFDNAGNNTTPTGYIIVDNVSSVVLPAGVTSIINKSLTYNGTLATFTFTIVFDQNSSFFEQYYRQNGFRYSAFVGDTTGRNNLTGGLGQINTSSGITSPLSQCAALYYKTSNGDVRSVEGRTVTGATTSYNRILRVTTGQGINSEVTKDSRIRVSDYAYQGSTNLNSATCPNLSRLSGISAYCGSISTSLGNTQITQITNNLTTSLSNSSVGKTIITTGSRPAWAVVNSGNSSLDINLASVPVASQSQVYIVKVESLPAGISKVRTIENTTSPDNIIVWCTAPSCVMEISPVVVAATTFNLTINSNNQIGYTTGAALNTFVLNKSRLFVNTTGGPTYLYSDPANPNALNIYAGAIVTNGYFYTNSSKKTNVVKGFVYAKSIVARGNGAVNTNDNRSLIFRDFFDSTSTQPKPLLFVDYDPKYFFVYKTIFVRDPESVEKTLVGT